MGFFDDLEAKTKAPPKEESAATESQALAAILDRIAGGWVWEGTLTTQPPAGEDEEHVEQHVRIEARGGRFLVTHKLAQGRRSRKKSLHSESERSLDRAGLVEMLRDQPLVARKLAAAAGGRIDPDRPDGASALDKER